MSNNTIPLTQEELSAFIAFGLIISTSPEELLNDMSKTEAQTLAGEVNKYLSPLMGDHMDVVTPVVNILKTAIEVRKGKQ